MLRRHNHCASRPHQRNDNRRPGLRRLLGRTRALPHSRTQPAVHRPLPDSLGGDGPDAGIARRLAHSAPGLTRLAMSSVSSPLEGEDKGGGSGRPRRRRLSTRRDMSSRASLRDPRNPPPLPAPARGRECSQPILTATKERSNPRAAPSPRPRGTPFGNRAAVRRAAQTDRARGRSRSCESRQRGLHRWVRSRAARPRV